jgi:nitrile hydratase subunit beta
MDGIHDMGGMHGFGPVPIEKENYTFKHDWQRRSFGLTQALASVAPYAADLHRQEIERMSPAHYLESDYFEKWIIATINLVRKAGLVSQQELNSGQKIFDVDLSKHVPVEADELVAMMKKGMVLTYPAHTQVPRFTIGDLVRVTSDCPSGHSRAPRYVRGRFGKVVSADGVFQFAEMVAAGQGPSPQHCYGVEFASKSLWGKNAEADDLVYVDLWESYLEPAG